MINGNIQACERYVRYGRRLKEKGPYLSYPLHKRQDRIPRLFRFLEKGNMPHFGPNINLNVGKRLFKQLLHSVRQDELIVLPQKSQDRNLSRCSLERGLVLCPSDIVRPRPRVLRRIGPNPSELRRRMDLFGIEREGFHEVPGG